MLSATNLYSETVIWYRITHLFTNISTLIYVKVYGYISFYTRIFIIHVVTLKKKKNKNDLPSIKHENIGEALGENYGFRWPFFVPNVIVRSDYICSKSRKSRFIVGKRAVNGEFRSDCAVLYGFFFLIY